MMRTLFAALFAALLGTTLSCSTPGPLSVEAVVFSSSPNPMIELNSTMAAHLCDDINSRSTVPSSSRSLGFVGFRLGGSRFVHAGGAIDKLILDEFEAAGAMAPHVLEHCRKPLPLCSGCVNRGAMKPFNGSTDCTKTPIVGPDTPPVFDVQNDDGGCFLKEQSHNNCYNYGTDIVTNDFGQPGMGSGQKWKSNTCDDVQAAAVRDGLKFVGTTLPTAQPNSGHIVALLIWPRTNFHWVRMDGDHAPFYWSHKPGGTSVRNTDNSGGRIVDPSKSNFSPWTQFCGYFTVVPSETRVKGDRR